MDQRIRSGPSDHRENAARHWELLIKRRDTVRRILALLEPYQDVAEPIAEAVELLRVEASWPE